MKRVFVSYSRNNLDVVTQLIQDVQAVGIDTWHDQTLTGGQRWWDSILSNIRESDIFICALSPEYWESEACKSELAYAVHLGKVILPVLVADGINLNLLSAPLNEIQVTDYRGRDKGAAFALIRCIHTAPANPPMPDPLPAPPRVPISYLSTLTERIDSSEPLDSQDQITLLFELEKGLREGRSPTEIRDLLLRLKRRDDLLAKVAVKIDAALRSLDEHAPAQPPPHAAFSAAASAAPQWDTPPREDRRSYRSKFCARCQTPSDAAARFCNVCGAALSEPTTPHAPPSVPEKHAPEVARSKSRRYACAPNDGEHIIADVKGWLDSQGFDSQQMSTEAGSVLLQIKKRGGWRDFVGMATSLNIVFHRAADTLTVEIGAGKWIDKAAVGTVSMFILWPLAVTAGFGAWEQAKMPEKVFEFIGSRLVYK
jgi:TIR domain-containing protein